jgi:uncharacterized beta barrel domain-containing protein DUF5777
MQRTVCRIVSVCLVVGAVSYLSPVALHAQSEAPATARADDPPAAQPDEADQDDAVLQLAEPEFRVINVPTTLPIPRNRASFELTHRFAGNLARGSFGSHAKNLFGLDQGAVIGLEFRYGIAPSLQAAVYRAAIGKTVQFHGKYDAIRQRGGMPLGISALASIEGTDNFTDEYSPSLGAVVSHHVGEWFAIYAAPIWVHNTVPGSLEEQTTSYVGLAARLRLSATVYAVGEVSPRIAGYAPGPPEFSFGIEKRAGGHLFQLNFSNTQGTTYAQIASGGSPNTIYLGFNLARKFF